MNAGIIEQQLSPTAMPYGLLGKSTSIPMINPYIETFNRKSISGLEAWYDASNSESITIDIGVSEWRDLSGNNRHLIQNTTNNQPSYNSVRLNNLSTVTFDGLSHRMATSATFSIIKPVSVFIVCRFESPYTIGTPRIFSHGTGVARAAEFFRQNTNDLRAADFGTNMDNGITTIVRFRKNTTVFNMSARLDIPSNEVQNFNIYDIDFGAPSSTNPIVRVEMAQLNNSTFGNVSIAEYLLFNRLLSVSDADIVRRYLGRKYNLRFQA